MEEKTHRTQAVQRQHRQAYLPNKLFLRRGDKLWNFFGLSDVNRGKLYIELFNDHGLSLKNKLGSVEGAIKKPAKEYPKVLAMDSLHIIC